MDCLTLYYITVIQESRCTSDTVGANQTASVTHIQPSVGLTLLLPVELY
jgi:hypothetical protein